MSRRPAPEGVAPSPRPAPAPIAVIGLGAWYPGAPDPRALWENVLARRQEFRAFREERMPAADYHAADLDVPDRTYGTLGAFLDGFRFDARAWKVPAQAFGSTDMAHWLALEVAAQALADAGHPRGEGLPLERVGVVVGNSLTGEFTRARSLRQRWPYVRRLLAETLDDRLGRAAAREVVEAVGQRFCEPFPATTEDTLAGALANTIAGRICGTFDFGGGGYVVDGACASSLLAVCTAASALAEGRVDTCLAGGVDISLDPFELVGFAKARALSRTDMRVYDRRGDGFIPGEGCGFVVLRRLEDARAAGDYVYAELRGWGIASDGRSAITAPRVEGQARAVRAAWEAGGVPDFVEGHGTGTPLGDRVELEALARVAEERGVGLRGIGVTSFKSIVGHTKAAAGVGAFVKAVAAVNQRVVPPTAGCGEPHPAFSGAARSLYPIVRGRVVDGALVAGVSAMGFGGIDAHVVVASGDAPSERLAPALGAGQLLASPQAAELLVLGAASVAELQAAALALAEEVAPLARSELVDLAAHLAARVDPRAAVRGAVLAATPADAVARLRQLAGRTPGAAIAAAGVWLGEPAGVPRVGLLCPGQGAQAPGAGASLLARDPALAAEVRGWLAAAEGAWEALLPEAPAVDEAEHAAQRAALARTERAQPVLAALALAWGRRLAALGVAPEVVAGHSLGEISALGVAGLLEPAATVALAATRGRAMAAPADRPAGMTAFHAPAEEVARWCRGLDGHAAVANVNAPSQVVVAGELAALEALEGRARRDGVAFRRLAASNGFHSALVEGAAAALAALDPVPALAPPRCRVVSTVEGAELGPELDLRAHVAAHARRPVDFPALVRRLAACDLLLEIGPGAALTGLVEACGGPPCFAVEPRPGAGPEAALAEAWVRGVPVRWDQLHAGRFVRPYRPDRVFLVNPCEAGRSPERGVPSAVQRREGPSNADQPDQSPPAASDPPLPAPPPAGPSPDLLAWLLDAVAAKTGFDRATLAPGQRLQDDLNLDSIKAGELVAAAARRVGVSDRVDPAAWLRESVGGIAEGLAALAGEQAGPASPPSRPTGAEPAPRPVAPPTTASVSGARWVRTFELGAVAVPVDPGSAGPTSPAAWAGARVHLLGVGDEVRRVLLAAGAHEVGADRARSTSGASPAGTDGAGHVVVAVLAPGSVPARIAALRRVVDHLDGAAGLLLVQRLDGRFGVGPAPAGAGEPATRGGAPSTRAGAAVFARSVSLERPTLPVVALDVDAGLPPEALADTILAARPVSPGFSAWGVPEAGARVVLEARPVAPAVGAAWPLSPGELVLVTGGARGITAACAEGLARVKDVRLALVGSTPADELDDDALRLLGRLAARGVEARYYACDLADRDRVRALVEEVRTRQGPIAGLLHGAGRNRPRRVPEVSEAEALAEVAPKIVGAEALFEALDADPPRWVAVLTSILGVTGMAGNAWYAWSNEALDLALGAFLARHPGTRGRAYAYGVWDEVGMGVRLGSVPALARQGLGALTRAEGVARFLALLDDPGGARQAIVTAQVGGLPTWPAGLPRRVVGRFLEDEVRVVPGVEAVVRTRLSPARDPWLRDHDYRGSLLFPTVFGLEAMAQAASACAGAAVVTIEDVELPAPVVVAEAGTLVEVRALVDEADPACVRCEVRTEATGFARPHFSAVLRLGALADGDPCALPTLPAPSPALVPAAHLYGHLLFQGPAFQRMGTVEGGGSASGGTEVGNAVVFPVRADPGPWVLGDPFARDALLQAGQLLVPRDTSLPVRIARIDLRRGVTEAGERRAHACIVETRTEPRRHVGRVEVVDDAGRLVERLEGYVVQVLGHDAGAPGFETILRPEAALVLPADLDAVPGLQLGLTLAATAGLSQPARRALAAGLAAEQGLQLSWSAEGRPLAAAPVSVAHDAGACLLARADVRVGVDVEPNVARDWRGALGPRAALLDGLAAGATAADLALAGARVWTAGEALYKAGGGNEGFVLDRRDGDIVSFVQGERRVVTFPWTPPRGPRRIVAVAWAVPAAQPSALPEAAPEELVRARLVDGRFRARFHVPFEESGSVSGRVPATALASWMGRLRELALVPLRTELRAALGSGRHGMVTQEAWVRLVGEAAALDEIEAEVWVEDLRPSSCLLRLRFHRVEGAATRLLGEAGQRFGWVDVLGHGQVRAASFPPFLQAFLAGLGVAGGASAGRPVAVPVGPPLLRRVFDTTHVDGNVVGNLYYTTWFKWAQRLLDEHALREAPEAMQARGGRGELVVEALRVDFLREAMPFDRVEVALHRGEGDAWDVVYRRLEADGGATRLAVARVVAAWRGRTQAVAPRPEPAVPLSP